jgi:hypothetical protein
MESIISLSEIVGVPQGKGLQICAKADAAYDQAKGRVFISLEAFASLAAPPGNEHRLHPAWLPDLEHVTGDMPRHEAADFAKATFRDWVGKVRESVPAERSAA